MALKNTTEKLNEYQERLKQKKAKPINRKHVEKAIDKLRSKHADLKAELKAAKKPSKQDRIKAKLKVVEELQSRADWLLKKIDKAK
jgi:uncharacterized protein HemX